MKTRTILCCLALLCAFCAEKATAQIKAYVCEGYDDEGHDGAGEQEIGVQLELDWLAGDGLRADVDQPGHDQAAGKAERDGGEADQGGL